MEFKDYFCLKERDSFTIEPKLIYEDARFYFGRSEIIERIKSQVGRAFIEPGVPKIIIYGSFGSGKTQTLHHLAYYLKTNKPESCKYEIKSVHFDIEMRSKSTHSDWHLQLMENLSKDQVSSWVESLFNKVGDIKKELGIVFNDGNLSEVVQNLRQGGDISFLAWRWLCGLKLTSNELQRLQVTRNLGDLGSGDLVKALVGIGRLAEKNGQKIVFFIDEAEQFKNVSTGDATESLHDYLRKLSELTNSSIGFIIGYYALTDDDMAELMVRQDIRTRLGQNCYIEIPPLPTVQDVEIFLKELLSELVDQKLAKKKIEEKSLKVDISTYPLSKNAFENLCEYTSQDPTRALPRNIIKSLNECAISAWDDKSDLIEEDVVNEIVPLVFG